MPADSPTAHFHLTATSFQAIAMSFQATTTSFQPTTMSFPRRRESIFRSSMEEQNAWIPAVAGMTPKGYNC